MIHLDIRYLCPVPAVPAPPSHLHANVGYPHEVNNHSRTSYQPRPATSQRPPIDCRRAVESHGQLKQKMMASAQNVFLYPIIIIIKDLSDF